MTEEVDAVRGKHALPWVDLQARFSQPLEYLLQVPKMLLQVVRPDDDVIDVAPDEGKAPHHFVHPAVEVGRGILEAGGDHQPFP